jgi:hypothetical protein
MALTINEANTVSTKYFDKTITQQVYERSPFFVKLKAAGNVSTDGGNSIQFPIRYAKLSKGQWVGARDQVMYTQKETRTSGDLAWKYLYGNAMISWDEVVQNSGKQQIVNLMRDKSEELREDMGDSFATALWAVTQDSDALSSMYTIVDDTEIYAGIDPADVATEWAASVEDASTTELVLYGANSISVSMNACTFGPHKPSAIFTTRDLWSKFESIIEPQKRYYNKDTAMAKAGFTSLAFHDAEVISDVYIASGDLFLVDTDQYAIRYHPKYNMKVDKWSDLTQAGYPYASIKNCAWVGNVLCRMRKTSGKYTALDSTI